MNETTAIRILRNKLSRAEDKVEKLERQKVEKVQTTIRGKVMAKSETYSRRWQKFKEQGEQMDEITTLKQCIADLEQKLDDCQENVLAAPAIKEGLLDLLQGSEKRVTVLREAFQWLVYELFEQAGVEDQPGLVWFWKGRGMELPKEYVEKIAALEVK